MNKMMKIIQDLKTEFNKEVEDKKEQKLKWRQTLKTQYADEKIHGKALQEEWVNS